MHTFVHPTNVYLTKLLRQGLASLSFPYIFLSHKKIESRPSIHIAL